jgi:DNA repair ATPase RecN
MADSLCRTGSSALAPDALALFGMMKTTAWTGSALLACALLVAPIPSAAADPDPNACQALQAAGPRFRDLDQQRAALQNQLKALRGAHPQQGELDTWRDLQRQLGDLFRQSQHLLEQTADGVGNEAAEQALRDQASAYQDLADVQDDIISSDDMDGVPAELTGRFNEAAGRIAPASDRLNAVERDVCANGAEGN